MRNKFKKVLKNRIFIFVLGGLIFGTVGVCAATYFASSDVTYDNRESGLSSTNVQGAIDELYNTCQNLNDSITIGGAIIKLNDSFDGLYNDKYETGKYTYKGSNSDNYVTFNNEKAGWRIVSINSDKQIKIIRINSIGNMVWHPRPNNPTNGWLNAQLNTYLNNTYYNSLTDSAKNQIVSSNYGVGVVGNLEYSFDNNNLIQSENNTIWNGKVGLLEASEFVRANYIENFCGTASGLGAYDDLTYDCSLTNWLNTSNASWIISTYSSSYAYVIRNGSLVYTNLYGEVEVRPVVVLSSEVQIIGGYGSQNNPYVISE